MSLFQNLRNSVGSYWSPGPAKQAKRTRSPSLGEFKSRLDRDTVSPSKRTSEWLKEHSVDIKTPKVLGVKGSRVTKPTPSKQQSVKAKRKFWDAVLPRFLSKKPDEGHQDDIEGTTMVEEDPLSISSDFDDPDATLVNTDLSHNAQAVNPALIKPENEDTVYEPTVQDLELMRHWSSDEVWLFHKLNMRGFEPLLSETWDWDFETVPDRMFSGDDTKVLIKAREGNEYNGR